MRGMGHEIVKNPRIFSFLHSVETMTDYLRHGKSYVLLREKTMETLLSFIATKRTVVRSVLRNNFKKILKPLELRF